MSISGFGRCALTSCVAVAMLAGCGASRPPIGAPGAMSQTSAIATQADRGKSWMLPQKKGESILVYGSNWDTHDVYVYDYNSGNLVGTLTGFDEPFGMCVDAKGDVYITNFAGSDAVEYRHGGTKPINTYGISGSEPIGCSVDTEGDVAITSWNPGEVIVYAKGKSETGTMYSSASCGNQWPMGYDNKGNLVGVGESGSSIAVCALIAGSKSETTLTTSGITFNSPGGTMWDGKYLAITNHESSDRAESILEVSLSGSTLTSRGEANLTNYCNNESAVEPFIVGKRNTPVNDHQGSVVVGAESGCSGGGLGFWHYPGGGDPFNVYNTSQQLYTTAASIGT